MSSSTFEVRETENENDRVLGFGLETCDENGIPSSQVDSEAPAKDHTYTKGPTILTEDAIKTEESSESQVEAEESNEVATGKTRSTRASKVPRVNKQAPSKSRPKKEPGSKKDSMTSKKPKGKKEILSEEGNTATEESLSDEKTDMKDSPALNTTEEQARPKRKGRKRKLEEKENVLDQSIVEEVDNIVEDASANDGITDTPVKKRASSLETSKEKKVTKAKQISGETDEDHNLPEGWVRKTVVRKSGKTAGQIDVYIYSPDGIKFRSKPDIAAYLTRTKSPFKLDDFNFSKKKMPSDAPNKTSPKKEKVSPVKPKLPTEKKKVQPVSPIKKGPKLLVKLSFSPKNKKTRNAKTEKRPKASKLPIKSGKTSGASSKGSTPRRTLGMRKYNLKEDELKETINPVEHDSKAVEISIVNECVSEEKDSSKVTKIVSSRPQRVVNRKSAIELLAVTKHIAEQSPCKGKVSVPAKKESITMVKQDLAHEDNLNNEKLTKRNDIDTDANDEQLGTKRKRQKSKVEEKENVLYKSIVEEVQNISEASKCNTNVEILTKKETLSASSYSSKEKKNNEKVLSPGEVPEQDKLPQGWRSKEVTRKSGKTAGHIDIYIFSPEGVKFRSKRDLAAYLIKNNSDLKLDDFNFSKKPLIQPLKSLDTKTD